MLYVVKELPEHVRLSEHLRGQAEYFLCVQSLGTSYYIPATPSVRRLFMLDEKGQDAKPDRRVRWDKVRGKADALRSIVEALTLQVRDIELAGVERNVTDELLKEMRTAMTGTIRKRIGQHAGPLFLTED